MSNRHIKFMDGCIARAQNTFNGCQRHDDIKLKYDAELRAEFYNLCGIIMREIDAMDESEFDSIMFPIRFARKVIAIHNPENLEWSNKARMYRKTKTFTGSKDNTLNENVELEEESYSD